MTGREDGDVQARSVILMYLAAHGTPNTPRPTHDEVGVNGVIRVAERCFDVRVHGGQVWAPGLPITLAENPWREVFGLLGSIGESLTVAAACEIEVEWHRRARSTGDLPAEMVIGQRFFSIAEAQEIIGTGHRLVNVVARALAARADVRESIAAQPELRRWEATHRPFVDQREAWRSANNSIVNSLASAVEVDRHPSYDRLIEAARELLQTTAWRELDRSRGQDFHRWRAESCVLAGIDNKSGHLQEIIDPDGVVTGQWFVARPVRYSAADDLEEDEARIAHAALLAVAGAVDETLDALDSAIEPLTHGRIRIDGNRLTTTIGGTWAEDACSCCRPDRPELSTDASTEA